MSEVRFHPDVCSTYHKANPKSCCHYDEGARKKDEPDFPHYFRFPYAAKRNLWNPLEPRCIRCGISIREIILKVLPRFKLLEEAQE